MKARRWSRVIGCTLSLNSTLDGGGWSTPHPDRFTSGKETLYSLYRRLGGPQSRCGRVLKIPPPTGNRSPDRPARSESLYQLRYSGPSLCTCWHREVQFLVWGWVLFWWVYNEQCLSHRNPKQESKLETSGLYCISPSIVGNAVEYNKIFAGPSGRAV